MPTTVEIVLPPERAAPVASSLQAMPGVLQVQLQRGAALMPRGDVVSATVLSGRLPAVLQWLDAEQLLRAPGMSLNTQRPQSVVSPQHMQALLDDSSEASWEEIDFMLTAESHMSANTLLAMALGGFLAAVGLLTDTLHVVIGAVLLSPGFEPLSRIGLGLVAGGHGLRRGAADTVKGYAALAAGAALAPSTLTLLSQALPVPAGGEPYLAAGSLLAYWTSLSAASLLASLAAGVAGAVALSSHRAVVTTGAMLVLGLVPSTAMIGLGAASGDVHLAAAGSETWLLNAGLVIATSAAVFGWKRLRTHHRAIVD